MILQDEENGIEYHIRSVPIAEAIKLKQDGIQFYDNTKLVAVNTCPTFGVLRYGLHKTEVAMGGRNLALECGSACHDFFAALRMWTLGSVENNQITFAPNIYYHGQKLFGGDRWSQFCIVPQDSDPKDNAIRFALEALHTAGYYDDPSDRKRTLANMELACIAYADRYFQSDLPVLVRGDFIGVEVPFVIEIKRHTTHNNLHGNSWIGEEVSYYCGRVDGVHEYGEQFITGENKTSGRLNDPWRMSFHMSTQVTGYNLALSAMLGASVVKSIIMGTQIPVPARDIYSGVAFEEVSRTDSDFLRWCEWFFHSVQMYQMWQPDPIRAPRYTHSCNRYFSICQFLPYCTATREEQKELIEQMHVDEWSPLDHVDQAAPIEAEGD